MGQEARIRDEAVKPCDNPDATHLLIRVGKDNDDLYRADGMLICARQADAVHFGNDVSTFHTRRFLSWKQAAEFVRVVADMDILSQERGLTDDAGFMKLVANYRFEQRLAAAESRNLPKAVIEDRDGECLLSLPGRTTGVDLSGLIRKN